MTSARKAKPQPWHVEISKGVRANVDPYCIGVGQNLEPADILGHAVDGGFQHLCQQNGHLYDRELLSATTLVESPESFLKFPIASILSPTDVSEKSEKSLVAFDVKFDSSNQKRNTLDQVGVVSKSHGLVQTAVDDMISVADEMFTNAIFNAPFVDMNTHKNPGISRHTSEVKLENGKVGRLFVAADKERIVIGCQDPYGSLDLKHYLKKIRATYERGPGATMNFGSGGAGIGSYIIFNAGSSLYFGVWPGRATIVCCVLPVGMSNRKRVELPKHLHWIQG